MEYRSSGESGLPFYSKVSSIHRTSTFACSPTPSVPLLATGTVDGALGASFGNESQLEICAPDFLDKNEYDLGGEEQHGPKGAILDNARSVHSRDQYTSRRFTKKHAIQVLSFGLGKRKVAARAHRRWHENGELVLLDPVKIVAHAE
jgi:protein transport protein SEC31